MEEKFAWHSSWWIGAGAFMLAAAIQLGSSVWPDKIKHHPDVVVALGIIGALFIIAGTVQAIRGWINSRAKTASNVSPLEIIFEPLNPARRFWEMLAPLDAYKRVTPAYWEHRVEVRNNAPVTLRNVAVTVEHTGPVPQQLRRAPFARTRAECCDINPGCSEMAIVSNWPHPKTRIGSLCGDSAWGYGPMRVVASADDTLPAEKVFEFNPETDQMLFERGKY